MRTPTEIKWGSCENVSDSAGSRLLKNPKNFIQRVVVKMKGTVVKTIVGIYEDIKTDLLDQLDRNGTNGKQYIDLIYDYMVLWKTKNLLIADIETRGVLSSYNNGGGQTGTRKNDSIDQLLKVNQQMLKLLDSLGIKPSQGGEVDEDTEM